MFTTPYDAAVEVGERPEESLSQITADVLDLGGALAAATGTGFLASYNVAWIN